MRRRRLDARASREDAGESAASPTSEQQIDIATAIQALPPIHRAAVHLFYSEGFSVEEIAAVLNIPGGTVKSRLHHAREALKSQLGAAAPVRNAADSPRRRIK